MEIRPSPTSSFLTIATCQESGAGTHWFTIVMHAADYYCTPANQRLMETGHVDSSD